MIATVRPYRDADFAAIDALWSIVFPDDPPYSRAAVAIPLKQRMGDDLFLVAEADGRIVGTAMAGWDGHRGWLYSVAVDPAVRRGGIGTALIRAAEERLTALGCAKINLQVRADNAPVAAFYTRLGYAVEERISMGKRAPTR